MEQKAEEQVIGMDKLAELQKSKLQQEHLAQLKYIVEFEKNLLSQVNILLLLILIILYLLDLMKELML